MLFKASTDIAALTLQGEEFKVVDGVLDSGELPLNELNLSLLASYGFSMLPEAEQEVVEEVKPVKKTRAKAAE